MGLTLLLGGARSGKSALGLRRAEAAGAPVVFIATAEPLDAEMEGRIARHRAERDPSWRTIEEPLDLEGALRQAPAAACIVVDCLSFWVANLLASGLDENEILERAVAAAAFVRDRGGPTVAISNEVGMGVVPEYELGRRYRDLLGWVNAAWAERAEQALLVVAGRTLKLEAA
jgi:adenosylcobinamide kinase/adenosylcobinamide-phosphate guanylyltransferase